jgi:lipopolysaccharide export system protein LptA
MPLTLRRLRVWIAATAVLLLAVLVVFIVYARYRARRLISDLPARIGANIERSSNGFTYSQSVKGRTAFTIHASRADQFKGGASATLHDVIITLYGKEGDRSDRISGSEFDYDQKAGVATAKGEVQIDLQGAETASATPGAQVQAVHIKTSGLVFNQKTELATTSQYVEFSTPRASGHSTGASYDVQKGLLVLSSAVELAAKRDGEPVIVRAAHVEFLRTSLQAFLSNPVAIYRSGQTSADQAIVYFRRDGTAEHIDARNHIRLDTGRGQQLTTEAAKILLDPRGEPLRAEAEGGLNFISSSGPRQTHGNAVEGTLTFAGGALHHTQARGAVSFVDQLQGLTGDPQGSATRELRASQVDIDFLRDPAGHAIADKVLAAGGATAVLHTIHTKAPSQNTTIKGDQLLASLVGGKTVTSLHGDGHTSILDIAANGASNFSSGDTLQVSFTSPAPEPANLRKPAGNVPESDQIDSAVQEGNVIMVQTPAPEPANSGKPTAAPARATARRAEYTGSTRSLRLTGAPRIVTGDTDLAADTIEYHRDTGNADASGNIKATYREAKTGETASPAGIGGQGPTHIIAASAALDQATGIAIFRGQARLWQGPNSVTAPVIELQRTPQILKAYGEPSNSAAVYTVIASDPGQQQSASIFRVHSRQLLYQDSEHKATFSGAVVAEDPTGTIHCDQVEAFLAPPGGPPAKTAAPPAAGRVDRIIATGHVLLQQPGRRGTGEKLVYTARDGKSILTGTSSTPPHLYDQVHGTVTGEALIFNSQDDSVSVTGGHSKAVTDTRTAR